MSSLNYVGHRYDHWYYNAETGERLAALDSSMPPPSSAPLQGQVIHAVCITDHTQPDIWVDVSGPIDPPEWWVEALRETKAALEKAKREEVPPGTRRLELPSGTVADRWARVHSGVEGMIRFILPRNGIPTERIEEVMSTLETERDDEREETRYWFSPPFITVAEE